MRTEKEYAKRADWAENDMDLTSTKGATIRRGAEAAAYGRSILEEAVGGPEELQKLLTGPGRPSIDPNAAPGEHARVREGAYRGGLATVWWTRGYAAC